MAGGLMIVGGMSAIGLVDNFVRIIAEDSGLWQFHFFRSLICIAIILVYCKLRNQSLAVKRLWAVGLRAFLMSCALLLYFGALSLMPIAVAGATLFSSPIFMLLFSVFLFSIRIGIWRILAVAIGFTGVIMILKPDPTNLSLLTLLPLLAGIIYALGQLVTRHLCSEEGTAAVMMGFFLTIGFMGFIGMVLFSFVTVPPQWIEAAPFFLRGWETPTADFLFWSLVQAIGSVIGVAGLVRGYQIAEPTYVAVFEYSFLIFAGFWGWLLWNEIPDLLALIGIVAIVIAGTIITMRSRES